MTERDLFLICHTHKIMIAACAHESIHRILVVLRLQNGEKGFLRTMTRGVAFVSVVGGKCQSDDSFVFFGTKPAQMACTQNFSQDWKRTRERWPRVKRRRQSRTVGRTEKWTEEGSRQERAVNRSRRKPIPGCEGPEAGLANKREWVSVPCDCVGISLEYTPPIAHKMLGKYHKLLSSYAWC